MVGLDGLAGCRVGLRVGGVGTGMDDAVGWSSDVGAKVGKIMLEGDAVFVGSVGCLVVGGLVVGRLDGASVNNDEAGQNSSRAGSSFSYCILSKVHIASN